MEKELDNILEELDNILEELDYDWILLYIIKKIKLTIVTIVSCYIYLNKYTPI